MFTATTVSVPFNLINSIQYKPKTASLTNHPFDFLYATAITINHLTIIKKKRKKNGKWQIKAYYSLIKPIPAYSSSFQPIPVHSSLFQAILAYCSSFQHIPVHFSLFQSIQTYSGLFPLISVYFRCQVSEGVRWSYEIFRLSHVGVRFFWKCVRWSREGVRSSWEGVRQCG